MNNSNNKGVVYFIEYNNVPGVVKIGMSTNVTKRFSSINMYAPFGATLIGYIESDDPEHLEKLLHFKHKEFRLNGEWFRLTKDEILEELDKYKSEPINRSYLDVFFHDWKEFKKYTDGKVYNSEFCDSFKEYIGQKSIDNRIILKRLENYCNASGMKIKKSRDHSGRYFTIYK